MSPWTFFLATLALWRVARMLTKEDGPLFLFTRLRILLGVVEVEDEVTATNVVGLIFACPLCLSVWLAIPLVFVLQGGWLDWLALSGATAALFRFTER